MRENYGARVIYHSTGASLHKETELFDWVGLRFGFGFVNGFKLLQVLPLLGLFQN